MDLSPHIKEGVDEFVKHFDRSKLLAIALAAKGSSAAANWTDSFGYGNIHVVMQLRFDDGARWAAKVPWNEKWGSTSDDMEREAILLRHFAQVLPHLPIPRVHAYGLVEGRNANVGIPYILMDWMHGSPLRWTESQPPTTKARHKVLRQIAAFNVELRMASLPSLESAHIRPPPDDVTQWLVAFVDRRLTGMLTGQRKGFDLVDLFLHRHLIENLCDRPEGPEKVPAFFVHDDLNSSNVLVGNEYKVVGILDWNGFNGGQLLPFVRAICFPTFLDHSKRGPIFDADRAAYVDFYRQAEEEKGDELCQPRGWPLLADDQLQEAMTALDCPGVLREMFEGRGRGEKEWAIAAKQLEKYARTKEGMQAEVERLDTFDRLHEMIAAHSAPEEGKDYITGG